MPSLSSRIPYSDTCSPRLTASVRSASLCCFDPVKCWSRLPYASGGTMRRSTGMPLCVTPRAPATVGAEHSPISGIVLKKVASASGSEAVATMSRSLHVSPQRRALPASSTCSDESCSRSTSIRESATSSAFDSSQRVFASPSSPAASAASTLSCAFGPKPLRSRIAPDSAAFLRSSSDATPSSSNSLRARLGPRPGMRVTSIRPGGYFALSFSADGILPVSSSTSIFSAIVLPTPASSVTRPWRASSATGCVDSRIAFAALW